MDDASGGVEEGDVEIIRRSKRRSLWLVAIGLMVLVSGLVMVTVTEQRIRESVQTTGVLVEPARKVCDSSSCTWEAPVAYTTESGVEYVERVNGRQELCAGATFQVWYQPSNPTTIRSSDSAQLLGFSRAVLAVGAAATVVCVARFTWLTVRSR